MPIFSPRRYQPPFYPYSREDESFGMRAFTVFEQALKGVFFGCRMCGNCILQETAFICPMTCPKGLRNGLCGGATPEACEVDPSRPCTWYKFYERAEKLGRTEKLLEINAPMDGTRVGRETWLDVYHHWRERGGPSPLDLIRNREKFNEEYDALFYDVRQPDWWQGDAKYHPPQYDEPISLLEANLRTGTFTTSAEIAPPLTASKDLLLQKVGWLKDYVIAANFTDNASASPRMNSMASSKICLDAGMEAVEDFIFPFLTEATTEIINKQADRDPKSTLQEIVQSGGKHAPRYEVVHDEGPDHAKIFEVHVYDEDVLLGKGQGSSKREASMEAALDALKKMKFR